MIRFTLNNVYKLLCIKLKSLIACPLYFLHNMQFISFTVLMHAGICINVCNYLNYYNNILYYYYSSGLDGIPFEWYNKFWNIIGHDLHDVFLYSIKPVNFPYHVDKE